MLRGGMVGAGAWSQPQLDAWSRVSGAQITSICDRHPDRSAPLREKYSIPEVFQSCSEMLEKGAIDFLDVCTRPYSHEDLVGLAIERKVPVLCQKPFCESVEAAERLAKRAKDAGVSVVVNENFRWQSWYRKIKDVIDGGQLGTLFLARFLERDTITMPHFNHPQAYFKEMPEFLLYEMGVHYLDTFRFLFGEPKSIFAKTIQVSQEVKGEDAYVAVLDFGGLTATIQNSWASRQIVGYDIPARSESFRPPPVFEIEGTRGTLILRADRTLFLQTHDGITQTWELPEDTRPRSRVEAQQHFIDCLRSGEEGETSAARYVRTMKLVSAAYESARSGAAIQLESIGL